MGARSARPSGVPSAGRRSCGAVELRWPDVLDGAPGTEPDGPADARGDSGPRVGLSGTLGDEGDVGLAGVRGADAGGLGADGALGVPASSATTIAASVALHAVTVSPLPLNRR